MIVSPFYVHGIALPIGELAMLRDDRETIYVVVEVGQNLLGQDVTKFVRHELPPLTDEALHAWIA